MARRTNPPAAVVLWVRDRDGWACVRCGSTRDLTTQHRIARGMGGSRADYINQTANLITLCGSGTTGCHGWVEHNPKAARAEGLSVSRYLDVRTMQVMTVRGWVLLDNQGGWQPAGAPVHI